MFGVKMKISTLDLQIFSMINMINVTEIFLKRYRSEFSKQLKGYFVSVLLMEPLCSKHK